MSDAVAQTRKIYDEKYMSNPTNRQNKNMKLREINRRVRLLLFSLLGNKCVWCGESDWRRLQIDHVNGNGNKDRQNHKGTPYYNYVIDKVLNGSKDYQLLCANCNWKKKYDRGEVRVYV